MPKHGLNSHELLNHISVFSEEDSGEQIGKKKVRGGDDSGVGRLWVETWHGKY